ncbi:hypothetical protein C4565_07030 [Candidatus Parcubacteria bacterium]|nr:MAG: hypothetical protein C4565_07030 [Candidatus Parcubacteria bacterium]
MEELFLKAFKEASRYKSKKEIEELCFKSIIDSYQRVKQLSGINSLNENGIRDQFVIDLETKNKLIRHAIDNRIIEVIPESWNPVKRNRSDIKFSLPFINRDLIFECKKLYSAESRYVEDGLIRFIKLQYSEKENDAGMIGFIINPKNILNIVKKIRERVCKCHFYRLGGEDVLGWPYSFQSIHIRINSKKILILHIFFEF